MRYPASLPVIWYFGTYSTFDDTIHQELLNKNSKSYISYLDSGILSETGTSSLSFPKTCNIACGWNNYYGIVLSGILGYFQVELGYSIKLG